MMGMESALWSAAVVEMLRHASRREEGGIVMGLNKVAADPTGGPLAAAVTLVNRQVFAVATRASSEVVSRRSDQ